MDQDTVLTDLNSWVAKEQAFGLVAKGCSAAQAECLRQIRDQQLHKTLDLTWDDFCPKYLGCSRATADNHIRNLQTLGAGYFRLAGIIQISPKSYRRIASSIHGETLDIDGELVPINGENASRIRAAVAKMRTDLATARAGKPIYTQPDIVTMQTRLDSCIDQMSRAVSYSFAHHDTVTLKCLATYGINKLKKIISELDNS